MRSEKELLYRFAENWELKESKTHLWFTERKSDSSSFSFGIPKPLPEVSEVEVEFSVGERYYYVPYYANIVGAWFGVAELDSIPSDSEKFSFSSFLKWKHPVGCEGGNPYYREVKPFTFWKVTRGGRKPLPNTSTLVADYQNQYQREWDNRAKRVNESLKSSGKDLEWLLQRLPPWAEEEEVVAVLTDDSPIYPGFGFVLGEKKND